MVSITRKAQTEAIGLVVIVILISLIFIFVIQFIVQPSHDNLEDKLLEIKANNLRNAILKTTYCPGVDIKEELISLSYGDSKCGLEPSDLKTRIKELTDYSIKGGYNLTISNHDLNLELSKGKKQGKITAVKQPIAGSDLIVEVALFRQQK